MLCGLNTIYNGLESPLGDLSDFQEISEFSDIFNKSAEPSSELDHIRYNIPVDSSNLTQNALVCNNGGDGWH